MVKPETPDDGQDPKVSKDRQEGTTKERKMPTCIQNVGYCLFAGGNKPYRKARKWWLDNRKCSPSQLTEYLVNEYSYLAGPGEREAKAHTIAVFLSQSKPNENVSVSSIALFVSLISLVMSIFAPELRDYPRIIPYILEVTGFFITAFILVWVMLRYMTNCCLAGDSEFRGRLSAL